MKSILKKQLDVFVKKDVDFLIAEVRIKTLVTEFIPDFFDFFLDIKKMLMSLSCSTLSMWKRLCGPWRC